MGRYSLIFSMIMLKFANDNSFKADFIVKRYIFLLVTLFVVVLTTAAQSGGISPDMLREIQNVQPLSPAEFQRACA